MGLLDILGRSANQMGGLLFPGMSAPGIDPQQARAAQAQAMMRFGAGLLGGAPVGQAYGAGQAAGWEPIEQARRQQLMDAAAQDRASEAAWRDWQRQRQEQADVSAKSVRDREQAMADQVRPMIAAGDFEGAARTLAAGMYTAEAKSVRELGQDPLASERFRAEQAMELERLRSQNTLREIGAREASTVRTQPKFGAPRPGVNPATGQAGYFQVDQYGNERWVTAGVVNPQTQKQQATLPAAEAALDLMEQTVSGVANHPGLSAAVGVKGPTNYLPGTEAQGFKAALAQLEGQAFLQAYNALKGGGQITEIEGAKATAAMARLSTAQSEKDFRKALEELRGVIQRSRDTVRRQASYPGGRGGTGSWGESPAPSSAGADTYYGR